ncbi:hypothetical protein DCC85_05435 [Paenibacillus sp. CAA11]|uniref:hypothetical protein n=1 Tax=Paenibacillus sp. CAA11 TaxID=1532905 RepID=UPI000D3630E4|nr:hypothetical protein [Paenibacillus sp. CAA11]AWB43714.1 hypothetical protein DCC85_05435 [Paenibacillus sp. CAA11]
MINQPILTLYEKKEITEEQLAEVLGVIPNALLLYDEGSSMQASDIEQCLPHELPQALRPAVQQLYNLIVKICHQYDHPEGYEVLQDCLSLQMDLWSEGILKLREWVEWLDRLNQGNIHLPNYDFEQLLGLVPEGFMIQDFHDELLFALEQEERHSWAMRELQGLYAKLGVTSGA